MKQLYKNKIEIEYDVVIGLYEPKTTAVKVEIIKTRTNTNNITENNILFSLDWGKLSI